MPSKYRWSPNSLSVSGQVPVVLRWDRWSTWNWGKRPSSHFSESLTPFAYLSSFQLLSFSSNLTSRYICKGNKTTTLKRCQFFHFCCSAVCSVMSDSLWPNRLQLARLLCPLEIFRQEYWSRLPFPTTGKFPDPGIEPISLCLLRWQVDSLPLCYLEFFLILPCLL